MSTTSTARSTAYNDRRNRVTRPRVPSLRNDAKQKSTAQDEPPVNTSNAKPLRNDASSWTSPREEINGQPTERRTETTKVITKERLNVQMRSPRKQSMGQDGKGARDGDEEGRRPDSRTSTGAESSAATRNKHGGSRTQSAVTGFGSPAMG